MSGALYREAVTPEDAIIGLQYVLGQIERAPGYSVNIGQVTAATSSLRMGIEALRALSSPTPEEQHSPVEREGE